MPKVGIMKRFKTGLTSCFIILLGNQFFAQENKVMLDEWVFEGNTIAQRPFYNKTPKRVLDILHMDLSLTINWSEQQLPGKATLLCKPYFKPLDSLVLDAKGLEIKSAHILKKGKQVPLMYKNDDMFLYIILDQTYQRSDTFSLVIDYVSRPEELEQKGGAAIQGAKGLYFVNSEGKRKDQMRHLWTQGEPESNSAWFPTIDKPNEKFTHEIDITLDTSLLSVSNGVIDFQTLNGDGTRTDYWVMDKPHSVYLVMLAVGPFATVKDTWQELELNYIIEDKWVGEAQRIFGNTPEMLTFYSDILGIDYPWQKYDQIVVREYVSGAMENTTAVIFGDFMYTDSIAKNDNTYEETVAHELFHHWFGDLVTCENWGNLALNEAFATYGEYLWIEYKYGKDKADWHLKKDLENYFFEAEYSHKESLIRTNWTNPDEMFDHHSYAKGGRILHMLRLYLGDEAFFEGLRIYLRRNAYQTAEVHDLRMALERASGEDLNWFFDQWFLAKGHPELEVSYTYDNIKRVQHVTVKQTQDLQEYPLYLLHTTLDIYTQNGVVRHPVTIDKQEQTFSFKIDGLQPKLVVFNSEKSLLAEVVDNKVESFWVHQLSQATKLFDRLEAMEALGTSNNSRLKSIAIMTALKDPFPGIREAGLDMIFDLNDQELRKVQNKVVELARADSNGAVRALAIWLCEDIYEINDLSIYESGLEANSYKARGAALIGLAKFDVNKALNICHDIVKNRNTFMIADAMEAMMLYGSKSDIKVMQEVLEFSSDMEVHGYLYYFALYAVYHPDDNKKALAVLEEYSENKNLYIAERAQKLLDSVNKELQQLQESETEFSNQEEE